MADLRTTSDTTQIPTPDEIVEALLVEAGAADELPTSESKLLDFLQLKQLSFDFMNELDFLPTAERKSIDLRAALSLNDRLVVTQSGLGDKRRRFGVFHEIGHFILQDHREKLFFLDTDATLSWWTRVKMEREANEIAAEILYQGNRFTDEALSASTSARTVFELAPKYGASYESALRRYTERHVLPCALIVFDRVKKDPEESDLEESEFKINYTITSKSFRKRYFSAVELRSGTVKGIELYEHPIWSGVDNVVEKELLMQGNDTEPWRFQTEVFTNGYKIFQFVQPIKQESSAI